MKGDGRGGGREGRMREGGSAREGWRGSLRGGEWESAKVKDEGEEERMFELEGKRILEWLNNEITISEMVKK
jgi:hypothetical protein